MKLNFLNVLNKKSAPDEIAEQIVALEVKKAQCEKTRNEAKSACKELRGKTMCGERVDSDAIKRADKAYEEAVLDLEIVTDSLEELNKRLYVALEAHREEESKQLIEDSHKWAAEKDKLMREVIRIKGRLLGLMIGIYHYESEAIVQLQNPPSFNVANSDPCFAEFTVEKNRALAELKKPTPADLEDVIHHKDHWLLRFNIEDEYRDILSKYRAKVPSAAD
jgi:hypothetical protein